MDWLIATRKGKFMSSMELCFYSSEWGWIEPFIWNQKQIIFISLLNGYIFVITSGIWSYNCIGTASIKVCIYLCHAPPNYSKFVNLFYIISEKRRINCTFDEQSRDLTGMWQTWTWLKFVRELNLIERERVLSGVILQHCSK